MELDAENSGSSPLVVTLQKSVAFIAVYLEKATPRLVVHDVVAAYRSEGLEVVPEMLLGRVLRNSAYEKSGQPIILHYLRLEYSSKSTFKSK
jgi:hypothetical protein